MLQMAWTPCFGQQKGRTHYKHHLPMQRTIHFTRYLSKHLTSWEILSARQHITSINWWNFMTCSQAQRPASWAAPAATLLTPKAIEWRCKLPQLSKFQHLLWKIQYAICIESRRNRVLSKLFELSKPKIFGEKVGWHLCNTIGLP